MNEWNEASQGNDVSALSGQRIPNMAERAATDPLDAFKADGTETIRPKDNVRNPLADCMRVIRLLGQADTLGYVGEQAAPIMEEALSLASDILKREVTFCSKKIYQQQML